jgi:hypothetical protein
MKTFKEVKKIVEMISYKDWNLRVLEKGDGFLLQVIFFAKCARTGEMQEQRCRKWYISSHCCDSEIVRTAFKAIEAGELHELHENFKYRGVQIFNPHVNVDDVAYHIQEGLIAEDVR